MLEETWRDLVTKAVKKFVVFHVISLHLPVVYWAGIHMWPFSLLKRLLKLNIVTEGNNHLNMDEWESYEPRRSTICLRGCAPELISFSLSTYTCNSFQNEGFLLACSILMVLVAYLCRSVGIGSTPRLRPCRNSYRLAKR